MNRAANRLLIFTRLPSEGRNKTRLIPALGAAGAARFHDRLAQHTFSRATAFVTNRPDTELTVCLDGGTPAEGAAWLGECDFREQGEGDLGERLARAAGIAFSEGATQVVIIGTDCPELDHRVLAEALDALGRYPFVFGPAVDGGYYLVGLAQPCAAIFEDISWGGSEVLRQSLAAAEAMGMSVGLLETLPDVDVPEDLAAAEIALGQ